MKKVTLYIMVIVCTLLLNSCTDTTKEFEDRIDFENERQLVDKDDSINPNTSDDDEVSNEEE